jgi:hypothetical protein
MAKRTNNDLQNTTQKETIQWPKEQTIIYKSVVFCRLLFVLLAIVLSPSV